MQKSCLGCFRILADDTRVRLIKILKDVPGGANVTSLTNSLGVTQPTVSHHLKALREICLVTRERQGKETLYTFNKNYPCKGCGVFRAPIKL